MDPELQAARQIAQAAGANYDAQAAGFVLTLERKLHRLRLERPGDVLAILNALEAHVEEGDGDPSVVRLLGDALLAAATRRGLPEKARASLQSLLADLQAHVATHVTQSP